MIRNITAILSIFCLLLNKVILHYICKIQINVQPLIDVQSSSPCLISMSQTSVSQIYVFFSNSQIDVLFQNSQIVVQF